MHMGCDSSGNKLLVILGMAQLAEDQLPDSPSRILP